MKLNVLWMAGLAIITTVGQAQAGYINGNVASGNLTTVISGGTVVDFESTALGLYPGFAASGVQFNGLGGGLRVSSQGTGGIYNTRDRAHLQNDFGVTPSFEFIFLGGPVSQFAFLFGALNVDWTMDAFDSANNLLESYTFQSTPFANNNGEYFGIVRGTADISRVLLSQDSGDWVQFDNLTYSGTAAAVPEPASIAMWGLGALGLTVAARRRRAIQIA